MERLCAIERDTKGRVIYRPGDGFGVEGDPKNPVCLLSERAIVPHTKLFHFGVIGDYIEREDDYVILESIGKGTAVGRLSWYAGRRYQVFRMNDPDFEALGREAAERASAFGRRHYDYALYLKLFTWALGYWSKELATLHVPPRPVRPDQIPYKTDQDFICIELYFAVWNLVGRRIRAHGHAPVPAEVIEALTRGRLVVIDGHDGNAATWRTPRGPVQLLRATLGQAAEDIHKGETVGLGSDGKVYVSLADPPAGMKERVWKNIVRQMGEAPPSVNIPKDALEGGDKC